MSLVKKREKYFKKRQKEFFERLKAEIEVGQKSTEFYKEGLERIGLEISDVALFLLKHDITSSIVFIEKFDSPYYVINFYDSEEEYKRSIKAINKNYKKEKNGELLFKNRRLEEEIDFVQLSLTLLIWIVSLVALGFMI